MGTLALISEGIQALEEHFGEGQPGVPEHPGHGTRRSDVLWINIAALRPFFPFHMVAIVADE